MIIRKATLADLSQIKNLYRELFKKAADLQPKYYKEADAGDYPKETIESENSEIFVSIIDDKATGLISVHRKKSEPWDCIVQLEFANVAELVVCENYRKQGIATALLNHVKNWAKLQNLHHLQLNALANNSNAINLYENYGFKSANLTYRLKI